MASNLPGRVELVEEDGELVIVYSDYHANHHGGTLMTLGNKYTDLPDSMIRAFAERIVSLYNGTLEP